MSRAGHETTQVHILALLHACYVTLGKPLDLTVLLFPPLHGDHEYLSQKVTEKIKAITCNVLKKCLVHNKHVVILSYYYQAEQQNL